MSNLNSDTGLVPGRYHTSEPEKVLMDSPIAGPSTKRPSSARELDDHWEDMDSDLKVKVDEDARSRESESQASSSIRQRTPIKSRRNVVPRPAASPRRRTPRKPPPPSPRLKDKDKSIRPSNAAPPSLLSQTFSLLLTTLRIAWTVFDLLISPVRPYLLLAFFLFVTVYIAYCVIIYYALPRIPTIILRGLGMLLRPLGGWTSSLSLPSWESLDVSDMDVTRAMAALSFPISGLATSSCALLGVGCQASLFTTEGAVAQPFWRRRNEEKSGIDDAQLAWALTQESRSARNIFESISTLGRKADVFEHIEIWKHGVAVSVESKLDDRNVLGKQLFALGDSSKDLHDEMRKIDSMTVTTFGNLHLEFNDLAGQLLSIQLLDPPDRVDTGVTLARRFDNILNRLDPKLDDLILRVSHAVDVAQSALDQSKDTTLLLSQISHELNDEISSVPAWKRVSDQVGHYINGGQVPRSKTVRRDLKLVETVVRDISSLLDNLERARSALLDYQSHTAGFKASLYGVHLAANGTLDLEAELRILTPLMSEFGTALDLAKEQRFGKVVEMRRAHVLDPAPS